MSVFLGAINKVFVKFCIILVTWLTESLSAIRAVTASEIVKAKLSF